MSQRFDTVRQHPHGNGHADGTSGFGADNFAHEPFRTITPANDFAVAREHSHEEVSHDLPPPVSVTVHPPPRTPTPPAAREYVPERVPTPARVPEPVHAPVFAPVPPPVAPAPVPVAPPVTIIKENPVNEELYARLNTAQVEIDRLRAALSTASVAPTTEVRRRGGRALSDDGSVAETDVMTAVDDGPLHHHQEGVPLQVVVIIALGVFITTYLFF